MNSFVKTALLGLLFLGLLVGCSGQEPSATDRPGVNDSASKPDTEVSGAKIYLYDRGRVTTEILSEKIIKFESNDSTMAYKLDIDVLDSTGQVSTQIVGDSGIIREATGQLYIYGNVVVITEDKSRLETDYLWWDSKADKIKTDAFVKITREDDVITGWGLEADEKLNSYKILNQVSGAVEDPDKLAP